MSLTVLAARTGQQCSVRLVRYSAGTAMKAHAHETSGVSLVLDGELIEEAEHRTVEAVAGFVVAKPRHVIHENRFGPRGATLLGIDLPADVPRQPSAAAELPNRWEWRSDPRACRLALRLASALLNAEDQETDDRLVDLLASLTPVPKTRVPPAWLVRVRERLDDPPGASIDVSTLASEAGVHPVYLARAFRRHYGSSLREYRVSAQVRRASHALLTTRRSISEVAHDCGFADHSHLCRAFRATLKRSPGALRQAVAQKLPER
jgi:AraC family transcriptional regulator